MEIKAVRFTKLWSRTLSGLYTSFTDLSTITFRIRCSTDQRGIGTTALKTSNPVMKYTLPKPCFKLWYKKVNESCILFNKISTTIIVIWVANFRKKNTCQLRAEHSWNFAELKFCLGKIFLSWAELNVLSFGKNFLSLAELNMMSLGKFCWAELKVLRLGKNFMSWAELSRGKYCWAELSLRKKFLSWAELGKKFYELSLGKFWKSLLSSANLQLWLWRQSFLL